MNRSTEESRRVKVLFNNFYPFMLAHGGAQVNIEQTMACLTRLGVENEPLEWWNPRQNADVLHHFGYLPAPIARLAKDRGWKVVVTLLLTETCNRSKSALLLRKMLIRSAMAAPLPFGLREQLPWREYQEYDRVVVGLEVEKWIMENVYGVSPQAISIVPSGMAESFLKAGGGARADDHLVTHGRIGPTKNCLELARLAQAAQVPILFIGRFLGSSPDYSKQFQKLVDNKYVKHRDNVGTEAELIHLLQRARGYVLMSRFENWCLAAHEAAACGLPVLVPDQPWSRERFGSQASYFSNKGFGADTSALRTFYERSPELRAPQVRLHSWLEVAEMLRDIYKELLAA